MIFWVTVKKKKKINEKRLKGLSECLDTAEMIFQLRPASVSGSHALFTGLINLFFSAKLLLKMGLTVLLTHLKIILLQCFQFLIFSNKRYTNTP